MTTQALDTLVDALRDEFRNQARATHLSELLGAYARAHQDWRSFALSSPERYTRNLVARDEHFELMILRWGPGHQSPIHNHEGQDCWMAILEGVFEELRYPMPEECSAGPLSSRGARRFSPGDVAFISDEIGLHLVRPAADAAAGGVSLHLYSSPIEACNCYCPETGKITRTTLADHSVRGRVLAPRAT